MDARERFVEHERRVRLELLGAQPRATLAF